MTLEKYEKLQIKYFLVKEEPELYEKYLSLMYEVFVQEQSWKIPCNHNTKKILPNESDLDCFIVLVINEKELAVAAIKGTSPGDHFSAYSLFEKLLKSEVISKYSQKVNYLNAVLVSLNYRKKKFDINGNKQALAFHVSEKAIEYSRSIGAEIILGATAVIEGALLIRWFGFKLVSPPSVEHRLYNNTISMALNSSKDQDIDKYLEECERSVLNQETFKRYVLKRLPKIKDMDISKINSQEIN